MTRNTLSPNSKSTLRAATRLGAFACFLLVPSLASANSCANTAPSYTYTPVAKGGGQAAVMINAAPGCLWEVVSSSSWIRIASANHGYGSGVVVFQVLANPTRSTRRGMFGAPAVCGETIGGRSSNPAGCSRKFTITVDQYGY